MIVCVYLLVCFTFAVLLFWCEHVVCLVLIRVCGCASCLVICHLGCFVCWFDVSCFGCLFILLVIVCVVCFVC